MQSWTIGAVRITRVVEMETPVPYPSKYPLIREATPEALRDMPWLYPHFVTEEGWLNISIHALWVEAPGLNLIVDTCVGNDKPRRMLARRPLHTPFLQSLTAAGCPCDSVQAVLCTHLHVDHVGWNTRLEGERWVPTFPNARYLIGRTEHAHWQTTAGDEQAQVLSDSIQPIFDAGLVELIEMDQRVSPEIRLLPTPGHTPGHVSVVIESQGERAVITGDVLHHPCQIGRPDWATELDHDRIEAQTTRRRLLETFADQPTLVIGTHFSAPTAGKLRRDGATFRFDV